MNQNQQNDTPIQPVEQPILVQSVRRTECKHWVYDDQTGEADQFNQDGDVGQATGIKNERTGSASTSTVSRGTNGTICR